ncbi:MAG: ABC transporter permease [Thermoplasmata archaeon]
MSITTSLSTKMNRRIFATIIGIAFCVTYLAGTTAMVGGLHETTSSLAAGFDQGPVLVFTDEDLASSRIGGEMLPGNDTVFVAFCFANVTLQDFHGRSLENVYAVSIYDPDDSLGLNMTNESSDSGVWLGSELVRMLDSNSISAAPDINYILSQGNNTSNIRITALYSEGSIFPDDWLLVPRQTMDQLRPDLAGDYSFLMLIDSSIPVAEQPFHSGSVTARPTSGVVGFFELGIYQVEQGLWGIILMSGSMTAVLVYCIISIETEFSAPTIKILRGIGARREYVIRVFMLKALFITLAGGMLGTAMGFCAASAISSLSSLMNVMTFITPVATFKSVVLPVLISMLSGLIGGFWPALRASKMFAPRRDAA